MERKGQVRIGSIGNAIGRLFGARDMRQTARELYQQDKTAFMKKKGVYTPLSVGNTVRTRKGMICVVNPNRIFKHTHLNGHKEEEIS